jgi:hypothetical protein
MMTPEETELTQMAADMEQTRELLLKVNFMLRKTMYYSDISGPVMSCLSDAQIDLENAIEQYTQAHDNWVAASM